MASVNYKQIISMKVDLVTTIDTSGSMGDELLNTQANIGKLLATLNNGRLDYRLHVVMNNIFPLPQGVDTSKISFVRRSIDSSDAISNLNALFAGQLATLYTDSAGVLLPAPVAFRKDAKLEIIVITDDNGSGTGNLAADFNASNVPANYTFNGIIGLASSVQGQGCDIAAIGTEYLTLITKTGGTSLDLCGKDWSILLTRLSEDIVKRSISFKLSKIPADSSKIQVLLDAKLLMNTDFKYDAATQSVTLLKTDAVKHGSQVHISYDAKS